MANLAIIPARGGSKRIPKKNRKLFLGKPIIAYSIEAAIGSGLFDEVMVSTDDPEIAEIAKKYGAKAPFLRTAKNSDDFATTVDVLKEVITKYSEAGTSFEYACCIYPTAPFITSEKLNDAFRLMQTENFDSVFPVMQFSYPIQRALKVDKGSKITLFQPEHLNTRSQDVEPAYHDAGQFYWFKSSILEHDAKLWTDNSGVIIIKDTEGQDIDTLSDWKIAEWKFKALHE